MAEQNSCSCFHQQKKVLYTFDMFTGQQIGHDIEVGVCWGTKERDECSCGGDMSKCDFYKEVRQKAMQRKPDLVEVVRKPVVGYEGCYEVDQFGRVFSVDRVVRVCDNGREYDKPLIGKQMKQSIHTKGYKTVSLTKDGKTKTKFVHRIVAEAFIPNADKLPMVNHKDEDKTNNFLENLEWCTPSYNRTHGKAVERHAKTLRGKKHTEEHKQKISVGVKRRNGERKDGAGE